MLTMSLPETLTGVLAAFAPCFTVRTFATFQALVVGFLAQPGARTVTGMLTGAGLVGRRHHDLAYRFFASARWSADQVGLVVAGLAVGLLLPADAPLLVAVDDTLLRRTGHRLHGAAWHHDGSGPGRHRAAWGTAGRAGDPDPGAVHGAPAAVPARPAACGSPATPTAPRRSSPASCSTCSPNRSRPARSTWSAMPRTPPAPGVGCPDASPSPPGCAATPRCTSRPRHRPDGPAGRGSKAPGCRT